jgi:hypothetical protein
MYKEVPGKPLWNLIEEKGHFYVFKRCLGLIEQLKEFSDTYFVNKLPPNTGIIHADFHMGNIIDNNNFLSIVDIENICIGNYDQMRREIALNIIGDPLFIIDKTDSAIELIIKNLCIDETTFSSHHDDIKKVINHFYDYYRDKKNYFEKEKSLREILIESSLKKELPKI